MLTNQGEELHQETKEEQVIPPEVAYALIDVMKGVIKRGTAAKAARMPYSLAGKTGTTNDFRDAWFIGFSPNLLCCVWVGYDREAFLGKRESGGTTALPIWMEFMSKALAHYPNDDFPRPDRESATRYVYPPPGPDGAPPGTSPQAVPNGSDGAIQKQPLSSLPPGVKVEPPPPAQAEPARPSHALPPIQRQPAPTARPSTALPPVQR